MAGESFIPIIDSDNAVRKQHSVQRSNGTDTVEQYVHVIGEPYLATYTIPAVTEVPLQTANAHLIEIMAGGTLSVCVRWLAVYESTAATASTLMLFSLFRLTSAGTGGTVITPAPHHTSDAAAGATAMTAPSSKGTETTVVDSRTGVTLSAPAVAGFTPIWARDWRMERTKGLWIPAGASNGIALKQLTAVATAGKVLIVAEIVESAEGA